MVRPRPKLEPGWPRPSLTWSQCSLHLVKLRPEYSQQNTPPFTLQSKSSQIDPGHSSIHYVVPAPRAGKKNRSNRPRAPNPQSPLPTTPHSPPLPTTPHHSPPLPTTPHHSPPLPTTPHSPSTPVSRLHVSASLLFSSIEGRTIIELPLRPTWPSGTWSIVVTLMWRNLGGTGGTGANAGKEGLGWTWFERSFPIDPTYLLRRYKSLDPQSLHKHSSFEFAYLRSSANP